MKRSMFFVFLVFLLAITLGGCKKGPSDQELFDQSITMLQNYFEDRQYVYEDLSLPSKFEETGANLTYTSNNTGVISEKGKIKRDSSQNKSADITVTVKLGSLSEDRTFKVTVLSRKYQDLERVLLRLMPKEGQMIYQDLEFRTNIDVYHLQYEHSSSFDNNGKLIANNDTLKDEKVKVNLFVNDERDVTYVFNFKIVPSNVKSICENIKSNLPAHTNDATEISLPTKVTNVDLTWKSLTPDVISDRGLVVLNLTGKYLGELQASFTVNNVNYQVIFEIINTPNADTLLSFIEDEVRSKLDSYVYTDLRVNLLASIEKLYGVKITTKSLNPEFIGDNGEYKPHEYDEDVTLEITVGVEDLQHTFNFNLVSRGIEDSLKVEKIGLWLNELLAEADLINGYELPITHECYHGRITWISLDSMVVDNNTIVYSDTPGKYLISAEVVVKEQEQRFFFEVDLGSSDLSEEEEVINFIERSIPKELNDVTTLYDGVLPNIKKELIPETAPYFYSMGKGRMKTPSQAILDQIYPGYQLPNEDNIVFIVVHETGMRRVGLYADTFSNLQINRSQNGFGGDSVASWHYTVDDHQIIQNFEDYYHLYHAGDGTGSYFRGGNSNGIGIEMCINPDGNFEAAKRNNAKLIAYLMHKYNLTLLNVKQHYDFSSYQKNCPETIRDTKRWYEFLGLIANEYKAQALLKDKEITYTIEENDYVDLWAYTDDKATYKFNMLNLYNKPLVDTVIKIKVKYNNKEYEYPIIVKA